MNICQGPMANTRICATINFLKNLNFSAFCRRKSYSQASMDVALLVINAAHLTNIIRRGPVDNLYYVNMGLVIVSMFLEVSIGLLIFIKERYNIDDESHHGVMNILNNFLVFLIFVSVVIHVFVSVFVEQPHPPYLSSLKGNCTARR